MTAARSNLRVQLVSILLAFTSCIGCAYFGRQRLDFSPLGSADRIEVRAADDTPVITVSDPKKVQLAIRFIMDRQDRWGDRISPRVPTFQLRFYDRSVYLGGYGISDDMLVAFPTHQGWWWRDVPAREIETLTKALGLPVQE